MTTLHYAPKSYNLEEFLQIANASHTSYNHEENQLNEFNSKKRQSPCGEAPKPKRRRKEAAGKERQRLKDFNGALESLQGVLPIRLTDNRKIHKKKTLQLAIRYIEFLRGCLDGSRDFSERSRFWCRSEDNVAIDAIDAAAVGADAAIAEMGQPDPVQPLETHNVPGYTYTMDPRAVDVVNQVDSTFGQGGPYSREEAIKFQQSFPKPSYDATYFHARPCIKENADNERCVGNLNFDKGQSPVDHYIPSTPREQEYFPECDQPLESQSAKLTFHHFGGRSTEVIPLRDNKVAYDFRSLPKPELESDGSFSAANLNVSSDCSDLNSTPWMELGKSLIPIESPVSCCDDSSNSESVSVKSKFNLMTSIKVDQLTEFDPFPIVKAAVCDDDLNSISVTDLVATSPPRGTYFNCGSPLKADNVKSALSQTTVDDMFSYLEAIIASPKACSSGPESPESGFGSSIDF